MRRTRPLLLIGALVLSLAAAGCGSDDPSPTPTSPTPAPAPPAPAPAPPPEPTPAPTPTPPPAPATLSSVTLSSSSVVGQSSPTGTVALTAPAPAGGASIRLESSNVDAARVPATVTVPAGATSATFAVSTATVDTRQTVTITATYADLARNATLLVTLARPRASFTVRSPTLGSDRCRMIALGLELDCRLDGSASDGRIVRWFWSLEVEERVTADKPDPGYNEIDVNCKFIGTRKGDTDSDGAYTMMKVSLEVTDKDGDRNSTSREIKLYIDGVCEPDDDDDDD